MANIKKQNNGDSEFVWIECKEGPGVVHVAADDYGVIVGCRAGADRQPIVVQIPWSDVSALFRIYGKAITNCSPEQPEENVSGVVGMLSV